MKDRSFAVAFAFAFVLVACGESSDPIADASAPKDSAPASPSGVDGSADARAGGDGGDSVPDAAAAGDVASTDDASDGAVDCACNSGRLGCPVVVCYGVTCGEGFACCAASPLPDGAANGQCAPALECDPECGM